MSEGHRRLFSVTTALYRRYRPESFGELIGQTQVTDPLRTAGDKGDAAVDPEPIKRVHGRN